MKNTRLFLLCGCPGSGKSTWAHNRIVKYDGNIISRDTIRFGLLDQRGGNYFDYEDEVMDLFIRSIKASLKIPYPHDVYVDATHLTKRSRDQIMRKLNLEETYTIAVWFDVPVEICKYRNGLREGRAVVPDKTIEDMYNRARKPSIYEFDEVWTINAEGDTILEEGPLV